MQLRWGKWVTAALCLTSMRALAAETLSWHEVGRAPDVNVGSMVFDQSRQRMVFLGATSQRERLQLERTRTGAWTSIVLPAGASAPNGREAFGLVYDPLHQRTLLFGGYTESGYSRDLWEWNGSAWRERTQVDGPPRMQGSMVAFDDRRGRMVVYGGYGNVAGVYVANRITWEWDGDTWTPFSPAETPPGRSDGAMSFDHERGRVVLYGGANDDLDLLGDTWEWDGQTWQQRADEASGPGPRVFVPMTYDPIRRRTVMVGGDTPSGVTDEVWEWDGQQWQRVTPTNAGPSARRTAAIAYDSVAQQVVVHGGNDRNTGEHDTWAWNGTRWTLLDAGEQPGARSSFGMTFDAERGESVVFGGFLTATTYRNDTWTWNGARWQQKATTGPAPRRNVALAYDDARKKVVLFGGLGDAQYGDTWEWDGQSWEQRATDAQGPGLLGRVALVYDASRSRTVLAGGVRSGYINDRTYTWDGTTWTDVTPVGANPSFRYDSSAAYDPIRQRVVMFGGIEGNVDLRDTWEWDGASWQLRASAGPPERSRSAMTFDARLGRVLLLQGAVSGGVYDDSWAWDGAQWTLLEPTSKGPARNWHGAAYDRVRQHPLVYAGQAGFVVDDLWQLESRGAACDSNESAATGFCVDGVACESSACAPCEICNGEDPGRCTPVYGVDDPDSCSPSLNGKTCTLTGTCRLTLGSEATRAIECASGYLVDGACCESAACGPCMTCNAAGKEIAENPGRCGTQRAGSDLRDECAATDVTACGLDGTCNGRGQCRLYPEGTACGAGDALERSRCTGGGECRIATSYCQDEHTVATAAGDVVDCAPYNCAEGACLLRCDTVADCVAGSVCTDDLKCVPAESGAVPDGCACDAVGARPTSKLALLGFATAVTLLARRRRRRLALAALPVLPILLGCEPTVSVPHASHTQALRGSVMRWRRLDLAPPSNAGAMTYDVARDRTLWTGVHSLPSNPPAWEWDGLVWRSLPEGPGPQQRAWSSMAYDDARQHSVLFGGIEAGSHWDDTWEWDGALWSQLGQLGARPIRRQGHGMVYDAARQRVVLFGGTGFVVNNARDFNDVWEWDGNHWSERPAATGAPSPRSFQGMVYDATRQRVVVIGGITVGGAVLRDTWEWEGQSSTWTLRDNEGFPPISGSAIGYHAPTSRIVAFGGYDAALDADTSETWQWDGTTWARTEGLTQAPAPSSFVPMSLDRARARLVLYDATQDSATWEWDGSAWLDRTVRARPNARFYPSASFDEARQKLVIYGGARGTTVLSDTWEWNGSSWQTFGGSAPAARAGGAATYDPIGQRTLLYGGFTPSRGYADLWSWNGVRWTPLSSAGAKPGVAGVPCFAFDRTRNRAVLFGGLVGGEMSSDETWTWDGTSWTQHGNGPHPDARYSAACAYDSAHDQLVLFGGLHAKEVRGDTWIWDGSQWSEHPGPGPEARIGSMMTYDAKRKLVVLFGGVRDGSALADSWEWDGQRWREGILQAAPNARSQGALTYDSAQERVLLFGGQTTTLLDDLWELTTRASTCTSNDESPTGFCVDGIACESATCGLCEACNTDRNPGRCTPVIHADDADTCGPTQGRTCDERGACRTALGQAATDPAQCVSGFVVDGVCCETATCDPCSTCRAEDKEIADNPGRCGTQRAGLDLQDQCTASEPSSCGLDGACDGRGACRMHPAGTRCGDDQRSDRLTSLVCSGAGACQPVEAQCDGDHTLIAASGSTVDCGAYACEGAACKSLCSSVADCAIGKICDASSTCIDAPSAAAPDDEGCSCRATGATQATPARCWLIVALLVRRRARLRAGAG